MAHRGPDDQGIYLGKDNPSVGLGHRRLSIIDLSEAGHQPMANEDGAVWIVANGEIYNYLDLRSGLINKGHLFKSDTDTEVILHLYEEYGDDCVKHLRGMFALAIWDGKKKILFLARDRIGKKPLLYSYVNGVFCFASEFAALLESGAVKKEINHEAMDYYLTFGYIPAPLTVYRNVFKLLPAHKLILKDGEISLSQYWQLDYFPKINISEEEARQEILRLLKEAVKLRLHSDVPLGAFLSGGIDSSTVVAIMSQLSNSKVKTFSIGFEDSDYSELKYARNIATRYRTEHYEFIVKPDALRILPLLVERYGEPYADSSCIPTYYVSKETKRFVTVALNGDGGDESFAGYERYYAMLIANLLGYLPGPGKVFLKKFSALLPDSIESKSKLRRLKRFTEAAFLPAYRRYARWVGIFNDSLKKEIYSEGFAKNLNSFDSANLIKPFFNHNGRQAGLDVFLNTDVHTYLPDDLLVKVDILSMANALECRSPFLDHKLMEFAARLPARYKLKGSIKKYILKKSVENELVPRQNIYRKKMGFGMPIGRWLRGENKDFLKETLLGGSFLSRGYFNPKAIKFLVEEHIQGRKDYSFNLWALLMLELWHQRFMD
jgi:asparagine synthase (glutamine-hydrolysing)